MLQFPSISNDGKNTSNSKGGSRLMSSSSLPTIKPQSKTLKKEHGVVVNTKQENVQSLPKAWTEQQLNGLENPEMSMTKLEWENQIARHILSLFATTKAVHDVDSSKTLLDFVDKVEKSPTKSHQNSNLAHTRPTQATSHPASNITATAEQETETKSKKVKKIKKKKTAPRSAPKARSAKTEEELKNIQFADNLLRRLEEERKTRPTDSSDKYRISNTIKTRSGVEIVVRGTPRCYPIWFVGTGDVYSDWTALPGDKKFQAHLNVLYENQRYKEYLDVIENVLIQQWREILYGKQEFTLGSFGKNVGDHTDSGNNSREGSRSASRTGSRSASRNASRSASRSQSRRNTADALALRDLKDSILQHQADLQRSGSPQTMRQFQASQNNHKTQKSEFGEESNFWNNTNVLDLSQFHISDGKDNGLNSGLSRSPNKKQSVVSNDNSLESNGSNTAKVLANTNHNSHSNSFLSPNKSPTLTRRSPSHRTLSSTRHSSNNHSFSNDMSTVGMGVPTAYLAAREVRELWRQLIMTCIAMGVLCIEKKNYDQGMELINKAEGWAKRDDILSHARTRRDLKSYVKDALSYFFFKKGKSVAALGYSTKAMEGFESSGNVDGVGTCLLHIAAIHSQTGDFKAAHLKLFEFLAMVENGRLAFADATPKQLCMVSIAYHNLAVVQLKLLMPDLACKNSQNARKIARLCLSYSNRWINIYQYTHEIAVADLKYDLSNKTAHDLTPDQINMIKDLSAALFDPELLS